MTQALIFALASAALLLAVAAFDRDHGYADAAFAPASAALEVPPLGQELFRMLAPGRSQAAAVDVPAQF